MESRRLRGFTLVEVMIAVSIMGIMAAVIAFNVEFTKQSAKHEAEKVVMYIQNLMKRSDRMHTSFDIVIENNEIIPSWEKHGDNRKKSEYLKPSAGCSYTPSTEIMIYDHDNFTSKASVIIDTDEKDSSGNKYDYYIKVTGEGDSYYVGISKNQ